MRRSILACGLLLAFAGMTAAVSAAAGSTGASGTTTTTASTSTTTTTSGVKAASHTIRAEARARARSIRYWSRRARQAEAGTERWLTVIQGRPPRTLSRRLASASPRGALRLANRWLRREHRAWLIAHHPPALSAWNCIHHYEGSWTDHGAPYWGGLQMDYSFQSTYAPWLLRHKGTADHWTSLEQIWTAVRAWRVRGFSPWPNTARDCGV
jgi:hypothetical protein